MDVMKQKFGVSSSSSLTSQLSSTMVILDESSSNTSAAVDLNDQESGQPALTKPTGNDVIHVTMYVPYDYLPRLDSRTMDIPINTASSLQRPPLRLLRSYLTNPQSRATTTQTNSFTLASSSITLRTQAYLGEVYTTKKSSRPQRKLQSRKLLLQASISRMLRMLSRRTPWLIMLLPLLSSPTPPLPCMLLTWRPLPLWGKGNGGAQTEAKIPAHSTGEDAVPLTEAKNMKRNLSGDKNGKDARTGRLRARR